MSLFGLRRRVKGWVVCFFFHCLAYPQEGRVLALLEQWHAFVADSDQIHLYMMPNMGKCFQQRMNVYELLE